MRLKYLAQTWVILTTKFVYFFRLRVTSTMSKPSYQCPYCKRNNFASLKGLTQHQQQNRVCFNKMREKYGEDTGYLTARETLECMPVMTINKQPTTYDYTQTLSIYPKCAI